MDIQSEIQTMYFKRSRQNSNDKAERLYETAIWGQSNLFRLSSMVFVFLAMRDAAAQHM